MNNPKYTEIKNVDIKSIDLNIGEIVEVWQKRKALKPEENSITFKSVNSEYFEYIAEQVRHVLLDVNVARQSNKELNDEAVNWARLNRVEVEYVIDASLNGNWVVAVGKAGPEATVLQAEVRKRLADKGIECTVKTEW